jgi:50S ribosomal protein L16 3-hydroxylase
MSAPPIEVSGSARQPLGMPAATFLRSYWQKHPLLIRHAFPDFTCPLTPNDLAGLACMPEALSRIVRLDRKRDRWQLDNGPFEDSHFQGLPERDWTLLVQDVDRFDPDVARLLDFVSFLPRWRIDDVMVSYAAPGGSVGAHVDQYDVFLVQGLGQRRWQIDARPGAPLGFREDAPIKLLQSFEASHDWVLAPGDVLYLPPGVAHFGEALDECLTLSIGMRAPSAGELLAAFAAERALALPEELRYADPDLAPTADRGQLDAAALKRLRQILASAIDAPDAELSAFFGRFLSGYRRAFRATPRRITQARIEQQIEAGAVIGEAPGMRLVRDHGPEGPRLHGDGETLAILPETAAALATGSIDRAAWAPLPEASRKELGSLLRRGWLVLEQTH